MTMLQDGAGDPRHALHFSCTVCGKCCQNLRLALSVAEAIRWLERGGTVELLCDAAPALSHAPGSPEEYRALRAVPARSGALPVTVGMTLTAVFDGPCPNRMADMYCAAYEDRPNTCRIYPAEVRPDRAIDPAQKLCPTDAWGSDQPLFLDPQDRILDETTAKAVAATRHNGMEDVTAKARLLSLLGIDTIALANEGFAIWAPDEADLLDALRQSISDTMAVGQSDLRIVSGRAETRAMIREAEARDAEPLENDPFRYLPLYE
jgi:Fe-S-cluster containining protein